MLDIKRIKQDTAHVKERLCARGTDFTGDIDKLIALDERRREVLGEVESAKARQNEVSKMIPKMKASGEDTTAIMAEMKALSEKVKADEASLGEVDGEMLEILYSIPNIPDDSVPTGSDAEDNKEVRKWGEPRKFDFEPKPHWEIGAALDILDSEAAAKVTGARFHFYKGLGARLERSIINFFLDHHTKNGYTEMLTPFMVNEASMIGTAQLPKFKEDMFKLEGLNYYLIPTAEVPLTNFHRESIIDGKTLPIKMCAYSACFRAEAGSAGRDTRGLIRQHQFNKVELVKYSNCDTSFDELEGLTLDAEKVLQELGLPHRTMLLCTGDMGFGSSKTYDLEVWLPSYDRYAEISSCSNMTDFQARRAGIRFKEDVKDKARLAHTLNGSGVAVGRTVAAILENYQNEDGSVTVPKALVPYMGCEVIR